MFLAIIGVNPITNTIQRAVSFYLLRRKLPTMAVQWFQDMERFSQGRIKLKFDPNKAIEDLNRPKSEELTKPILIANTRWNVVWAQYMLDFLRRTGRSYPGMINFFNGTVRRNTAYLTEVLDSDMVSISLKQFPLSGNDGLDLIVADILANTYTDHLWGELVEISPLTAFRDSYINAIATSESGTDIAILAKSIAFAEIMWSNNLYPWRDVSDMITFELSYRLRFQTSMLENFLKAANIAGANLPLLSAGEMLRRMARNPNIEEVVA